jgi:hypothetical protein
MLHDKKSSTNGSDNINNSGNNNNFTAIAITINFFTLNINNDKRMTTIFCVCVFGGNLEVYIYRNVSSFEHWDVYKNYWWVKVYVPWRDCFVSWKVIVLVETSFFLPAFHQRGGFIFALSFSNSFSLAKIFRNYEKWGLNIDVLGICRPFFYDYEAIFTALHSGPSVPWECLILSTVKCVLVFINGISADFFCHASYGTLWRSTHTHISQNFLKRGSRGAKSS